MEISVDARPTTASLTPIRFMWLHVPPALAAPPVQAEISGLHRRLGVYGPLFWPFALDPDQGHGSIEVREGYFPVLPLNATFGAGPSDRSQAAFLVSALASCADRYPPIAPSTIDTISRISGLLKLTDSKLCSGPVPALSGDAPGAEG